MSKCKSCGEKPQKSRAFPSAVVEINNPEQLVLLRKVVIPASMPEETNPPVIGRYKNVILQYEDTNHLYIYSSDGIPTPIEANVPQEILDRIDTLESDVDDLERDLADETEARQTGDSDLSDRIDGVVDDLADEADARELADERLEDAIDTKQDQLTAGANIAIVDESGVLTISAVDTIYDDTEIRQELADETLARQQADNTLQSEIDTIVASSDVKDIVGTYAELEDYDTSTLGDRDIIKVLQDETQLDQTTYYRWSTSTETFSLIGAEGPYYTKAQTNELLDEKQDELTPGENISIVDESGDLVISAQDTTYTAGYGLELNGTEFSVDPDIVQDTLTAGDNITIEDESGSLVISATDTTYTAGSGLNLTGTTFSVDTSTIATQADLDTKQDVLTAGQNIHITDESGNLVISADSTTYTAGEAIDITNSVISATNTGKTKVLTSADYNNPTDNPTSVALWKLEPGLYSWAPGVAISAQTSPSIYTTNGGVAQVWDTANSFKQITIFYDNNALLTKVRASDGVVASTYYPVDFSTQIVDNLTSTSNKAALSAKQGKVLKDLIDAIPAPATYTAGAGLDLTGTEFSVDFNDVQGKLTAGQGISIVDESGDLVISATSTGPNVVQTTGTSTTDVMSQNAATKMIFQDPSTKKRVAIGPSAFNENDDSVAIGKGQILSMYPGVAIGGSGVNRADTMGGVTIASQRGRMGNGGYYAVLITTSGEATGNSSTAIGRAVSSSGAGSIALGAYASASTQGEMNIGLSGGTATQQSNYGYNGSAYRLLTGLYDPQSAHDAATKGYVDNSLLGKQDALTAGSGISIADESGSLVISTTVTAPDEFTSNEWNALWS